MGFLNSLGGFFVTSLGKAASKMVENANTYSETSEKASDMSDEELKQKYKKSNNNYEKMAYAQEYKFRRDGNQ